jgi:hypothetical protein
LIRRRELVPHVEDTLPEVADGLPVIAEDLADPGGLERSGLVVQGPALLGEADADRSLILSARLTRKRLNRS